MVSDAWPRVTYEDHEWRPTLPPELTSARVRARHAGPYRAAVAPKIVGLVPVLPPDVADLVAAASVEITRFDAELGAEVAPFASALLRSESASSSRIENLSSGAKSIVMAELGDRTKRNATAIAGNVAAMNAAIDLADRLDEQAVLAMHRALLESVEPGIAGRWREGPVWIGGDAFGPHGADYIAPHTDRLPELMADLMKFSAATEMSPLVKAAIAHAQFETIHPFPDGNGRTGRALIHAVLRNTELTRLVTVPVSAGLLSDTSPYFAALKAYRDGDPVPIVERLSHAAIAAVANGRLLARDLHVIRESWRERIVSRHGSASRHLAEVLLRQPVVNAHTVARELGVTPQNAHRAIAPLAEAGILDEFTGFARHRMWQAREVLDALDDFAARAGRRA